METTAITTTASVTVSRLALYLALVAAMALLNCAFLKAATPEDEIKLENWMLDMSNIIIADQEINLEDWMTLKTDYLVETEIEVENWMTDNSEYVAESDVQVEYWMCDHSEFFTENNVRLEPWMISPDTDIISQVEIEVENWMIDGSFLSNNNFLVRK